MARLRIAFMGSPEFSVPALDALVDAGLDVAVVYTQPPRPAGRGEKLRKSTVHRRADELRLSVRAPENFKNLEEIDHFRELCLDAAVVCAYGLILPPEILTAPRIGCINIHASLLPRWRGAAPIQRAIMAGDDETGISIMQVDEGLDTGPIYCAESIVIGEAETAGELHDRLAQLGARLIVEALPKIASGELKPTAQPEAGGSYAKKIDKTETRIDWLLDAQTISRRIRALSPAPGAWCEAKGERLRILNCEVATETGGQAGEILDDRLLVACGKGAIRPLVIQRQGRQPLEAEAFLRGFPLAKGEFLR